MGAPTAPDIRQSVYRAVLNMAGTAANATVDSILSAMDGNDARLFENNNVLLTDGGLITWTGTQVLFTENLNLVINSHVSGASPTIISLGSSTQTLANGSMLIATVNRSGGSAVMSVVTTMPAVSNANEDVWLIAKRIDAGDGTQRIYFRNGMALNAGQTARLGASGSGSGSGSGIGDDLDSLLYRASFNDPFAESGTSSASSIDVTAGHTNAVYDSTRSMWAVLYDASKTVAAASTTTTINLSANASYTVAAGDMVIIGSAARKITAVISQSSFTTEAFASAPSTGTQVTVSQAVHTKDIYNFAPDGVSIATGFPGLTFSEITVDYKDNGTASSNLWTPDTSPFLAFTASPDGTNYTSLQVRVTNETDLVSSTFLPSAGTSLYLRFFADKTSGSGTVNLITYKAFMQKIVATSTPGSGVLNSAIGLTNGAGTPVNMTISTVGGKTTATLTFSYAVGLNPGTPYGSVDVYVNGQMIPRFINSTLTPDASYTETSGNVITLDSNYSAVGYDILVIQRAQVVDSSTANTTNISALQEVSNQGFQGFVNTANVMSATSAAGSPAAGSFYSTIFNRAALPDFTQDLKPRMGIERMSTQSIYALQSEFGPNGEQVFAAQNDLFGQIRFVGGWSNINGSTNGSYAATNSVSDYCEITFYGTGLNILTNTDFGTNTWSYSVDGGGSSTFLSASASNTVLNARNYAKQQIVNVVAGLTLGVHTVKITQASVATLGIFGFEILNESSSVKVPTGIAYVNGQKLVSSALSAFSYSAPVTGTKGGRVLVYLSSAGVISQAFTAVNASQANLTSADHTNEEVARIYYPREFGAGRSDDFSGNYSAGSNLAFTLDDGTTTLVGAAVRQDTQSSHDTIATNANGSSITITFIGTGLDITEVNEASGGSDSYTATIDGTAVSLHSAGSTAIRQTKIVSGLPYGTHVVKLTRVTASTWTLKVINFIVYQPKKPSLPAGAVELADYNVMANYVASSGSIGGNGPLSTGVLYKAPSREMVFTGSSWAASISSGAQGGVVLDTTTTGDALQYTFFGTGVEAYVNYGATAPAITVQIDGSAYTGSATATNSGTWTPGTSTWQLGGSSSGQLQITGLTLGVHTVKFTKAATGSDMEFHGINVITPIHSTKSNLVADLQNTLLVGSNAISDNRKTTPVKDILPVTKAWAQALGVISSPTTSSSTFVPMPDMSCTIKTSGGAIEMKFNASINNSSTGVTNYFQLYVDGVAYGPFFYVDEFNTNGNGPVSISIIQPVSSGAHKIDLYWRCSSGTLAANGIARCLSVKEL